MRDLTAALIRNITAPLWERRDGLSFRADLRRLTHSQFWDPEKLAADQKEKLNRLLRHAYQHCPAYHQRLQTAGYSPAERWEVTDLPRLPVLEKDDVREQMDELLADNFDRSTLRPKRTGGSTAVPLHLLVDNDAFSRKTAATWRHNRWAGFDIGDQLAMIWGATPPPQTLRDKIRAALYDRYFALDTLKMTEEKMVTFVTLCWRKKPRILLGHAHSIFLFAEFCLQSPGDNLRFDAVITTAMVLRPAERRTIEQAFQTKIFNRYGSEELSIIASECPEHNGLHLFAEGLISEVLVDDQPAQAGEFGDLVFTDLENYAMPFIRYRIGDVAALASGACPCGRSLPRLVEVRGRTADFLYTPEGNRVFGISVLDTMLIHVPGIKQAQIIQREIDLLDIRLVISETFAVAGAEKLQAELPQYFGPRMRYNLEFVDRIPPEKNGKYRFAICLLSAEQRASLIGHR